MPENTTPDNSTPQQPEGETAPIGAASGNRWEPTAPEAGQPAPPAGLPPTPPLLPPEPAPSRRPGRQALLAGGAAAALVIVGASAFALGSAAADGGRPDQPFQVDQQGQQLGPPPGAPHGDDDHGFGFGFGGDDDDDGDDGDHDGDDDDDDGDSE